MAYNTMIMIVKGTDVTQSTESLELSRLEHHNKKQGKSYSVSTVCV